MTQTTSVKAAFVGCENIKHFFPKSRCAVLVSVGQIQQEGDNFKAIIALVNKHFKECTIVIGDSLQRHNLNHQHQDSMQYYQISIAEGDAWIYRNQSAFSLLTIPNNIERWDTWRLHSQYQNKKKIILSRYDSDDIYKNAVDSTINDFICRIYKRNNINKTVATNNCFNYLIEELTILMLMMPEYGYNYAVYPNKIPKAFQLTHDIFVKPQMPYLMHWTPVRFRKKTSHEILLNNNFGIELVNC